MVDKKLVMEGLKSVLDPEIGRSIVDLNMVRDISINDGRVNVKIALTVAHCPVAKTLQADVESAVQKLEGQAHPPFRRVGPPLALGLNGWANGAFAT